MALMNQIGEIVRTARGKQTIPDVARAANVDPERVRQLELGEMGISTTQLERIARHLELDSVALRRGERLALEEPSVFLKHRPHQDFTDHARAALDRALDAGRALWALNELLGEPPGPRRGRLSFKPCGPASDRQGYDLARAVRAVLGATTVQFDDLAALAETGLEIAVLRLALGPDKVSAVSIRASSGAAAIVLNADDSAAALNPAVDRVSIAHEICHVVFDESAGGLHLVVDWNDTGKASRVAKEEQRARQFAAELLLPREGLEKLLGPPRHTRAESTARDLVGAASDHFQTPWEIAVHHLRNLGFLADEMQHLLLTDKNRVSGTGRAAGGAQAGPQSRAVLDRVRRAHQAHLITDGQARVALDLPLHEALPWVA